MIINKVINIFTITMKKLTALCIAIMGFAFVSYAQEEIPSAQPGQQYGKAITQDNAIDVNDLTGIFDLGANYTGKIKGEVVQVCVKKGCFVSLKREGDAEPIMVRFKDYAFFMPQDIVGRTIVVEGAANKKEISVESQKHLAEDAGKSAAEIAQITAPKTSITILADGVVVVK